MLFRSLTAWWGDGGGSLKIKGQGRVGVAVAVGLIGALILGVSGSITALVDTLYSHYDSALNYTDNLAKALHQDLFPGVHVLIRVRMWHPVIAIALGIYCVIMARYVSKQRKSNETELFAHLIALLFGVQIAAGFLNLFMLAPIWMQLVHLLLADLLWVALVLLAANALAKRIFPVEDY